MVYPRVCGGTAARSTTATGWTGLSPRVRGNLPGQHGRGAAIRSIPACAGEPVVGIFETAATTVYPRVCGGTDAGTEFEDDAPGLSPRVRGNQRVLLHGKDRAGSIPACAGEPPGNEWSWQIRKVYPRVCGGTPPTNNYIGETGGLSPRVRGNHSTCRQTEPGTRSIPACAGEPVISLSLRMRGPVYPRVCGGTARV